MENINYGAVSDCGDMRKENQDHILCLTGTIHRTRAGLFAVADGMGGLSYGAEASNIVVHQLADWWKEDFPSMVEAGRDSAEDIRDLLDQVVWEANQAVLKLCAETGSRCGSTLSLLFLYKERYYVRNVGDSRIYRLEEQGLRQITTDHSYVAEMVRQNRMTEEQARLSPKRNLLTRCIGRFQEIDAFCREGNLEAVDRFLLCSDGLYTPLELTNMDYIMRAVEIEESASLLRRLIKDGEARDNVSAITLEVRCSGNRDEKRV